MYSLVASSSVWIGSSSEDGSVPTTKSVLPWQSLPRLWLPPAAFVPLELAPGDAAEAVPLDADDVLSPPPPLPAMATTPTTPMTRMRKATRPMRRRSVRFDMRLSREASARSTPLSARSIATCRRADAEQRVHAHAFRENGRPFQLPAGAFTNLFGRASRLRVRRPATIVLPDAANEASQDPSRLVRPCQPAVTPRADVSAPLAIE